MLPLDPVKLLIVGVVALVVLGPDKLPAAARKISSLVADLQRFRASLHSEVQAAVGDLPLNDDLGQARQALARARQATSPRQALYRSIGLGDGATTAGQTAVPGSIDLDTRDLGTREGTAGGPQHDPSDPLAGDPALN